MIYKIPFDFDNDAVPPNECSSRQCVKVTFSYDTFKILPIANQKLKKSIPLQMFV